jgi:hypothetical protein
MRPPFEAGTGLTVNGRVGRTLLEPAGSRTELLVYVVGAMPKPPTVTLQQTVPVPLDVDEAAAADPAAGAGLLRMMSMVGERAGPAAQAVLGERADLLRQMSLPAPARSNSSAEVPTAVVTWVPVLGAVPTRVSDMLSVIRLPLPTVLGGSEGGDRFWRLREPSATDTVLPSRPAGLTLEFESTGIPLVQVQVLPNSVAARLVFVVLSSDPSGKNKPDPMTMYKDFCFQS